jgi:hypothetical protein
MSALPDDVVAIACGRFQTGTVEDSDPAPGLLDQASGLKRTGGDAHPGPADPEHNRKELLGEKQLIPVDPVMSE